jgi:hypothetical protein
VSVLDEAFGDSTLPRANGEVTFDAPWQGRALAMAVSLVDHLDLEWDAFRGHLISAIESEPDRAYWDSFAAALDAFVAQHV